MEIQPADKKLRFVTLVILLLLTALALVALLLFNRWLTGVQSLPAETALNQLRFALLWLVLAACLSLAGFGAWLCHLGARIAAAQRFPLPGARLIRDTPVLVGEDAARRGRLVRNLGWLLILGAAALAFICWRLWLLFAIPAS